MQLLIDNAKNSKATFVFAHGAGANMEHEFMHNVTQLIVAQQISVVRFNFPYMIKRQLDGKRYPPDRMPKLLVAYQELLTSLDSKIEQPLFIGGKSMGGRVAATLLSDDEKFKNKINGLICLGYPFHPQKKPEKLRLAPLLQGSLPTLILQGSRDALGDQQEISHYGLPKHCTCKFLEDGDHGFKPRVKSGVTLQQNMNNAVQYIIDFVDMFK